MLILAMILGAVLSPSASITLAAHAAGRPDLADDVLAICHRESRCREIGVHERDAHLGEGWYGQVRLHKRAVEQGAQDPGHLDPTCQPYRTGVWATHGIVGLSAGSHWKSFPTCYEPEVLDNSWVSAVTAIEKYERECWAQKKKSGWCRVGPKPRRNNVRTHKHRPARKLRPETWSVWSQNAWRGVGYQLDFTS